MIIPAVFHRNENPVPFDAEPYFRAMSDEDLQAYIDTLPSLPYEDAIMVEFLRQNCPALNAALADATTAPYPASVDVTYNERDLLSYASQRGLHPYGEPT